MQKNPLVRNLIALGCLTVSIFLSAVPLWANSAKCKSIHRVNASHLIASLQTTLAQVPMEDFGLTLEKWKSFQSSLDSVFPASERTQKFLWGFSQTLQKLKGVSLGNPSQAAMRALREGQPMPDDLKPLKEIETAVLSFVIRLDETSSPPDVLLKNYRALLMLASDATPQEIQNLKAVFATQPPDNPRDLVWSAAFIQTLDAIQKRLGHRLLQ